ncbi:MAG TPA: hypothetical protein VKA15_10380 [Isosphaeraceae bacterium]|nr:hypothetical protein [Isosphaeraceae bacterium]
MPLGHLTALFTGGRGGELSAAAGTGLPAPWKATLAGTLNSGGGLPTP